MNVGEHYAMRWPKYPHLLDATIVALEREHVVCDVDHRCTLGCEVQQMRRTLPIDGRIKYDYDFFTRSFVPRNMEAIALSGGFEPKKPRLPRQRKKPHITYADFMANYAKWKSK